MAQNKACDILIKNATYLDSSVTIAQTPAIAIKDGTIIHIGGDTDWEPKETFDDPGFLWMPGLVDGHTHTSQQLLRGRLLDEKPIIWRRINVPFEGCLTEETSRLSAQLCALEMIKSGTTGFLDAGGHYLDEFAEVYLTSGLRGRLSYMTNDNPGMPDKLRISPRQGLERQIRLKKDLYGTLLDATFSVTALTAASEELIRTIFNFANENGIATEVHMNEYGAEVSDFISRYGKRPFEWLDEENLIGDQFTAAHCIFLSPSEIDVILKHAINVIHCPFSNCGKGIPQTPQLLHRGATVGFGSDGSAHGGLDLFREMRLFRGVMNSSLGQCCADSQVMPASTLLKMATSGGASVLNADGLGTITENAPADLIALNANAPHLYPTQNLINTLVESASGQDVMHSIVNGKALMRNRHVLTLDEEKILASAREINERNPIYWN